MACYASGDDDTVKAKIKDVSKATFKNWLGAVSPSDGSNNYVKVFNSSNVNSSDDLTVNDLADQGFAAAMIAATEDSPIGSGWFHALNLGWGNSKIIGLVRLHLEHNRMTVCTIEQLELVLLANHGSVCLIAVITLTMRSKTKI